MTFRHPRERYQWKKWPSKHAKSRENSYISDLDSIFSMIGCILGGTIVAQHLRDLKTSFLMFSGGFQHRFWNFDSQILQKCADFENSGFCLVTFFGWYLSRECRNITGKPGFVVFSSRRYILKKISSKNIKFSKSYRFFKKDLFFSIKKVAEKFSASRRHSYCRRIFE